MADVKIHEGTILASIRVEAPPEKVFRAITEPEHLLKWWGADDKYRGTVWEIDLRPGGKWRTEGKGADGTPYSVEGEYLEVVAPHLLSYTWNHSWRMGNETAPETLVTWVLVPKDGGTLVTLTHSGFVPKSPALVGHGQGWVTVLDWLRMHLEE